MALFWRAHEAGMPFAKSGARWPRSAPNGRGRQPQLNLVHVIHAENGKVTKVWTQASDPGRRSRVLVIAPGCASQLRHPRAAPEPAATQISLPDAATRTAHSLQQPSTADPAR